MSNLINSLNVVSEVSDPSNPNAVQIGSHYVAMLGTATVCEIQDVKVEMDAQSSAFFDTPLNTPIDLPVLETDYSLPSSDAARLMLVASKYQVNNNGTGGYINTLTTGAAAQIVRDSDPVKPTKPC